MFSCELVVVIIIASVVCSLSTHNEERKRRYMDDVGEVVWVNGEHRNVTDTLTVTNGGQFGEWGQPKFCDIGMFAVGYNMKIEPNQYNSDDTALNAITLLCNDVYESIYWDEIHSEAEGPWGDWVGLAECNDTGSGKTFLKSFSLQVHPYQGVVGDDTSANFVKFTCQDFSSSYEAYELVKAPGEGLYGTYGEWSESCGPNSAICGFQTKVEGSQGYEDDTTLNDVKFFCCELFGEWE